MIKGSFKENNSARVSFAVIGIFLILGSSATTIYIEMMDEQYKDPHTWNAEQKHVEILLSEARVDLSQIINNAGVNALQYISSHPVIKASDNFSSAELCQQYRLKNKIAEILTDYLYCNYAEDTWKRNEKILSIDFTNLSNKKMSLNHISISPITLQLSRPLHIPFFGPEQQCSFPVYYQITVDIPVVITSVNSMNNKDKITMDLSITTVLTARYLLLKNLVSSFNESLQNFGPFWKTITLLTNIYSMARGYLHYKKNKPQNIVDNHHLEFITNLVFLFEEALSFGGISPQLLIETIKESKSIFSNTQTSNLSTINALNENDWNLQFSEFQGPIGSESPPSDTSSQKQLVNISDIAGSILWNYTSCKLYFLDTNDREQIITYNYNSEETLEETIQDYIDQGWMITDTKKGTRIQNQSTMHTIRCLCESVYSTTFSTNINRLGPNKITIGSHDGFPIDNGSSSWTFHQALLQNQYSKPQKGSITPGSIVHSEIYAIVWKRFHHWSSRTIEIIDNETIISWNHYTTQDTRTEYNVSLSIQVDSYGNSQNNPGEIKDVFYENISYIDSNLETTIQKYKTRIYDSNKQELFTRDDGLYFTTLINESVPLWVMIESNNVLITVYDQIANITVDEEINSLNYPNPSQLLSLAFNDIIGQFQTNKTQFEQQTLYVEDDLYYCTGKKAVYTVREWYVNQVESKLNEFATQLQENVDNEISDALENTDVANKSVFDEAMDESMMTSLQRQLSIPLSIPMQLQRNQDNPLRSWNESVLVSLDHSPSYSSCFSQETIDGKKEYFLGIRNSCLLGPTGLPILPITPTTPWLVTLNTWLVQIRGEYAEFSVSDMNDETVFHPLFCHEPLEYTRKNEVIRASDGTLLGWNTRLSYRIDTVACSLVPSWGCMVGETDGILIEHHGKSIS